MRCSKVTTLSLSQRCTVDEHNLSTLPKDCATPQRSQNVQHADDFERHGLKTRCIVMSQAVQPHGDTDYERLQLA